MWWIVSSFKCREWDRERELKKVPVSSAANKSPLHKKLQTMEITLKARKSSVCGIWLPNKGHDKYTVRQLFYFLWLLVYILNATLIYFLFVYSFPPLVFHFLVVPSQFSQRGREKVGRSLCNYYSIPDSFYKALNYFVLKTNKQNSDFQPGRIFNCFLIT